MTDEMGWEPRHSIRLRIKSDNKNENDCVTALQSNDFANDFIDSLCLEVEEIIADLSDDLAGLNQAGLPKCKIHLERENWKSEGRAEFQDNGEIRLSISLGFCLALDDVLLSYLSNKDAFMPDSDIPDEVDDFIVDFQRGKNRSKRPKAVFFDYTHLKNRSVGAEEFTERFPLSRWRLRQQDMLFRLALRWALLHEFSHAALCHLELIDCFWKKKSVSLAIIETGEEEEQDLRAGNAWRQFGYEKPAIENFRIDAARKVMELHADTSAFWLSIDITRNQNSNGSKIFRDYEADIARMDEAKGNAYIDIHSDRRTHYLLFSALASVGLFEHARKLRHINRSNTHPSPEARLISLVQSSFYASENTEIEFDDGFILNIPPEAFRATTSSNPWDGFLQQVIVGALMDFNDLCRVCKIDFVLFDLDFTRINVDYKKKPENYNKAALTEERREMSLWYQDVLDRFKFQLDSLRRGEGGHLSIGPGGAELRDLHIYHGHIDNISDQLQIQLRGAKYEFIGCAMI